MRSKSEILKQFGRMRLALASFNCNEHAELPMRNLSTHDGEEAIDRSTSAAIRNAIGERLRRDTPAAEQGLPGHIQSLLNELERRERSGG
jgi:hypothetical protein